MKTTDRKILDKDINKYFTELDLHKRNINKIKNKHNISEIFEYFKYKYDFKYNTEKNAKNSLKDLNKHMGWSKFHDEINKFFKDLKKEEDKEFFLKKYAKKFNTEYLSNSSLDEQFKGIRHVFDIYGIISDIINNLVADDVENKFNDLRKIILFYNLRIKDHIPEKISKCKKIIKNELYVNIYDFQAGKKTKFKNLRELSNYTKKNKLFFPLRQAKDTFTFKVFLRQLH